MFTDLLEPNYGEDISPKDDTHIVQVLLYFSEPEAEEFKKLCKEAMKIFWTHTYIQDGNISDLLLKLLRDATGSKNIKTETTPNG